MGYSQWTREPLEHERQRIRTEISFLVSDRGGPNHDEAIRDWRSKLEEVEEQLARLRA